jgi:hypothetical protein
MAREMIPDRLNLRASVRPASARSGSLLDRPRQRERFGIACYRVRSRQSTVIAVCFAFPICFAFAMYVCLTVRISLMIGLGLMISYGCLRCVKCATMSVGVMV